MAAAWMMISHGMGWTGGLLSDTWALDIARGVWTCIGGEESDHPVHFLPSSIPPPLLPLMRDGSVSLKALWL